MMLKKKSKEESLPNIRAYYIYNKKDAIAEGKT